MGMTLEDCKFKYPEHIIVKDITFFHFGIITNGEMMKFSRIAGNMLFDFNSLEEILEIISEYDKAHEPTRFYLFYKGFMDLEDYSFARANFMWKFILSASQRC